MGTKVQVNLKVVVELPDTWGDECTFKQLREQSIGDAEFLVKKALSSYRSIHLVGGGTVKVVADI